MKNLLLLSFLTYLSPFLGVVGGGFLLFSTLSLTAQTAAPEREWQRAWGYTESFFDAINGKVLITADSCYLFATRAEWSNIFSGDAAGATIQNGQIFLVKVAKNGHIIWQKQIKQDYVFDLQHTNDGNFVMLSNRQYNNFVCIPYITKLNPNGGIIWQRAYADIAYGHIETNLSNIRATADGGYIFTGTTEASTGVFASKDTSTAGFVFNADALVVKVNSTGGMQWHRVIGSDYSDDIGGSIVQTTDGNYIFNVVGGRNRTRDFSPQSVGSPALPLDKNTLFCKLSPTGAIIGYAAIGESDSSCRVSMENTPDGNLIISGDVFGCDGDFTYTPALGNYQQHCLGHASLSTTFILKMTPDFTILWKKWKGGTNYDSNVWATPTPDGGYVSIGITTSSDVDAADNPYNQTDGLNAVWIVKYDGNGEMQWQKFMGSNIMPYQIRPTPDGGYIVLGQVDFQSQGGQRETDDNCGHYAPFSIKCYWICKLKAPPPPPRITGITAIDCHTATTLTAIQDEPVPTPVAKYQWSTGDSTQAIVINGALVGTNTYTVTITYENRCTKVVSQTVNVSGHLVFPNSIIKPAVCTKPSGSIVVAAQDGAAPYRYVWNTAATTPSLSALPAATYTVTATDNNGCTGSTQIVVSSRTDTILPTLTTIQPRCAAQKGSIAAAPQGGTAPYSILPTLLIGLSPNTYTVSVTDANGCTATATQIINAAPAPLTAALTTQNGTCGQANASIAVAPQGGTAPYTILPTTLIGLSPNTYTVSVTDANGCATTATAVLTATPPITATLTATAPLCRDEPTGSIRVSNIQNAVAPVGFAVDNGNFTPTNPIQNVAAGLHTARLLDASGCDWQDTIRLANPPLLTVNIGRDTSVQLGDSLRFTATVTGAAPSAAVQYAWSCGAGGSQPTLWLQAKNNEKCTITVTDANGCTATATRQISIKDATAVYIPTAFSPNDDGTNDDFAIYGGVSVVAIKVVRIFDRWGELVYEAFDRAPNTALWNGNWSAHRNADLQKAVIDVYVYYTEIELIDGSVRRFTGDLTVLR